jgi:hypothetical protein
MSPAQPVTGSGGRPKFADVEAHRNACTRPH